jgi:hypothetical protein
MRSSRRLVLAAALLLAPCPCGAEVVERILAAVDSQPLLASETSAMARLRGFDTKAALEALIDEELMYREASRLPQAAPTPDEAARALASLEPRVAALPEPIPAPTLERIARREATIVKYAGFRFAPQVRVEDEEVQKAYDKESAGRQDPAPFEERAAALRAELSEQKLGERIEAWVKELRSAARIRYNDVE